MHSVLISTYEMGRQPFGLASAAAWLREAGWSVTAVDVAKDHARLEDATLASADLVAFHLPMHTATRLAEPIIVKARRLNAAARLCAFGLYAPLNAEWLRSLGVDEVLGGEFEADLAAIARKVSGKQPQSTRRTQSNVGSANSAPSAVASRLPRLQFLVPDRTGLPPLSKYATLQMPDGQRRLVGYTEASRGCRHLCRHCPVVPIYQGQFRVVQPEVVLADVAAQVAAGAGHITFGDPDFFNGPTHAMRVVTGLHAAHPSVSYDVTIKVEHLLRHRDLIPRLAETGCAFVTSAVESIDDRVLAFFDKGHTRAGFVEAVTVCRVGGIILVPTFVAFHPWLTLDSYCELLDTIARLGLVDRVAPIQLAIRLLVPKGSRLLALDEMRVHVGGFDPSTLTYRWSHPDPRVDELHRDITAIVGTRLTADRPSVFAAISALAHERAGVPLPDTAAWASRDARPARDRATIPYLNEPWYC